ncbi:MAG: bifunctional (p)ppGpp synthetase/guanosine-3',5'-bis(diphosphate) 3'-pyrophosphohydrolase [Bacteroides sp.]|nr:bifunctional (p)ppGpp synthetase/guanosine-3',5'-bis(diphosphate) 3'-pyrophosphohydrolase [Barnesiella sp.]MBD5252888.1 bifunctional (p)ppGpp synthetase/guanosine-3',5'-bis(diphosphate) 3'-pyrophosphohydrolase [Barnesiella sp.]MBD5345120.1 bifunctional (p)ppGpp synthetase/guanosine-3',5'-bis(diphosphate) 3'-pyrophosphohydrolase [Bacteroides sp.]MBD5368367.1 bifunctional (p)ppGpp synthetase/guanosine-3',5'-bis(diphosphate) 3'-pyrophosphohydrolase [Bacteroides sp.]MDE5828671.1 RelA/SpoT family
MEQYNLTSQQEEQLVDREFRDLLDGYLRSNHRKKVEIIERAFQFAKEAHKGIRRRSGEPYILHPIAVAKIASREIGLGSTSICAALLHDVVEDTEYTVEDIEQHFGKKIAMIVAGLTKISGGIFGDKASAQAENFRKLLLTMSEDIRVVLIKMADRLHNMRTLGSMAPNKQYKIAGETLYIYAPLAHRLGLFEIKTELEDLSFKYEHPKEYARIEKLIKNTSEDRDALYSEFAAPIHKRLNEMGIEYEARNRLKSIYSIWRKMETKHIPFEEVYDLFAMRIIFECPDLTKEKETCYKIYSAITDLYRPHPERTRDWVTIPKANGYQALHVTLMGPDGNWIEVQIRSRRMDEIAEKGFAAHWKYKQGESDEESELNEWLSTIKDILEDPTPNAIDFLDTLKLNLFSSEIAVFTPKGEIITLPAGASVLDVAFSLHSEIGIHCIAGKVNHKLVPLSHRLQSGDQVEILTSQSQSPKPEWKNFLASAKAKTRLRKELRRVQMPLIEKGKEIFEQFLKEKNITLNNNVLTKILGTFKVANREELFYKLGAGEISLDRYLNETTSSRARSLLSKIFTLGLGGDKKKSDDKAGEVQDTPTAKRPKINTKEKYVLKYNDRESNFVFADCCRPIPGDEVMGFINDNGEVEVHELTCPRAQVLKASYGPRIVATSWDHVAGTFHADINIEGIDRHGILQELTGVISSQLNINIRSLNIEAHDEVFTCRMGVLVSNIDTVSRLCKTILKINGVKSAVRAH